MKRKYLRALSGYLNNPGGIDKESARKYLEGKGINADAVRERLLRRLREAGGRRQGMEDGKWEMENGERDE